jgi:hypothetical protein
MTVANDALLVQLGTNGFPLVDGLVSSTAVQGTATKCIGQVSRFTKVTANNNTAVLPSVNSLEASGMVFVINDDPANQLQVWPQGLETIGGANAAVAIPAGQSGIFIAVTAAKISKGGGRPSGSFTNDWRWAPIP